MVLVSAMCARNSELLLFFLLLVAREMFET